MIEVNRGRLGLSPLLTLSQREALQGFLYISPWIFGFLIFTVGPMIASGYLSLTDYNIVTEPRFAGFSNYEYMFEDRLFWKSVENTLYYTVIFVPISIVCSLALALLLNQNLRGRIALRTLYFLPSITPVVASTIVWLWIFNGQFGILNEFLRFLGLSPIGWLTDPDWVKPSLIFMGAWFGGNTILIYLAGLQDVPHDLLESAELDGANALQKTFKITLPMISPVIFYTIIVNVIGYFQYFTEAWVMTATRDGAAGGVANSAMFYSMYLYQTAFQQFKMGYASAQAWILFMIVLIATAILFRTSGWVYYHGEN